MPTLVTNILITALQTSKSGQHKFNTIKYPFFQSAMKHPYTRFFGTTLLVAPTLHFKSGDQSFGKQNGTDFTMICVLQNR
jgi:hypothetical protein